MNPTSMSPAQARQLVDWMMAQSQASAVSALLDPSGDSGDSTDAASGMDFSSLLANALDPSQGTGATSDLGSSLLSSVAGADMPSAPGASDTGNQIAAVATQLAGNLQGPQNRAFDPATTPAIAQAVWNSPNWGNGNVQCVAFVDGAYRQAGITLPAAPNGSEFWGAYAGRKGWQEIPNGQGLPRPGDILAFSGGAQGFGHVGVVTSVTPPQFGQPGCVTFTQSNSPTSTASLPITADGVIQAWPGYQVQGSIRYSGA